MSIDHAELELFRDNVKRFLENEIAPHYVQWEKDSWMPREFWNKLGENGLLCVDQPEQYGGVGVPFQYSMVILNEMAKMGLASLATGVSVHSDICAPYVEHLGTQAIKDYGCRAWRPVRPYVPLVCRSRAQVRTWPQSAPPLFVMAITMW